MKAVILLATLKASGQSNTATLVEFLIPYFEKEKIDVEVIRLAEHKIVPGTYTKMEEEDAWPAIYEKLVNAKIIIFATPIWWNTHSSELQRAIERLDEVYDIIQAEETSPLDGKVGGMIITGDSDGAESVTGNIANFFGNIGVNVPAYCSIGVIWEGHAKDAKKSKAQLMKYYQKEHESDAKAMAAALAKAAK